MHVDEKLMIVFRNIDDITEDFRGSFVTIGNFDGVHLSHQFICRKLAAEARSAGVKSLVITFDPHPKMILHPNIHPFYLITSLDEKLKLLENCGVDGTLVIPFTLEYAKVTARQFVYDFLGGKLVIKKIIVGHDYTFGQARQGNSDYLIASGAELGFKTEVVDAFKLGDEIISSTLIRNLLLQGDVSSVFKYMGRWYNVYGTVVSGHGRGTGLGFPTANLEPEKELLTPPGIYAAFAWLEGKCYLAALNVGAKPTFADYVPTYEAFLLDFSGDLRGKKINILFVEKLRDIIKFDNPELLKRQIAADVEKARNILLNNMEKREQGNIFGGY